MKKYLKFKTDFVFYHKSLILYTFYVSNLKPLAFKIVLKRKRHPKIKYSLVY